MLRLSKLADYGIVLMTYIARNVGTGPQPARDLASRSNLPLPTVSKVLKALCRAGLLVAHRGKQGGYSISRSIDEVSVADMIAAIDGPIALTECGTYAPALCDLEPTCPVRQNWVTISLKVREALENLSLADLQQPGSLNLPSNNLLHLPR